MASPAVAVANAPKFGGLSGFRNPTVGRPTSVPTGLPAFRGAKNTPGDGIQAPAIQASKNRHDRGTNVTIPYARVVPIGDLANSGRCDPGDVLFCSRRRVSMHQIAGAREQRVCGLDWLNTFLGNGTSGTTSLNAHLKAGHNVLLDQGGTLNVAEEWRRLKMLDEWTFDGIVLSNDPESRTSSGVNDAKVFNVAVQGHAMVNNGFVDLDPNGVVVAPSTYGVSHSLSTPTLRRYKEFAQQVFDRNVRTLSNLFVGLVAQKQVLTPEIKAALTARSQDSKGAAAAIIASDYFYTFKFVCFSDRIARQEMADTAEPVTKRQRIEETSVATEKDFNNMVGAWRIGRVMDAKAKKAEPSALSPMNTSSGVMVSVASAWWDWRKLRRHLHSNTLGSEVPGAAIWDDASKDDDGRVLLWPTTFAKTEYNRIIRKENVPLAPQLSDEEREKQAQEFIDIVEADRYKRFFQNRDRNIRFLESAEPSDVANVVVGGASKAPTASTAAPKTVGGVQAAVSKPATPAVAPVAAAPVAPVATAPKATATAPAKATMPSAATAATATTAAAASSTAAAPAPKPGRPAAAPKPTATAGSSTTDVFTSIFGKSTAAPAAAPAAAAAPTTASAANAANADSESDSASDAQPSPNVASGRARVRRARDGR